MGGPEIARHAGYQAAAAGDREWALRSHESSAPLAGERRDVMRLHEEEMALLEAHRPTTIETARLQLVVLLPREIRALIVGDIEQASKDAGVLFPPGWPEGNDAREGLPWHLQHLEASKAHRAWRIRVVVERATGLVVGSVNLKGPPDGEGDVEVGWGISESHRRRGYALEAVSGVIDWALRQPGTKSLSATIDDDNIASQRLAAKLGLARTNQVRREKPVWYRPAAYQALAADGVRII